MANQRPPKRTPAAKRRARAAAPAEATANTRGARAWIYRLGALRVLLLICTLVVIVLAPAPGTRAVAEGWAFVPTLLAPVLAPLLLMLLMLDALMTRIFMSDAAGAERARLKYALTVDLAAAALLLIFWLPYFLALGGAAR